MSLLELLEAAARGGPQAIDQVLADVELPHVDGRNVTFLFRGEAQGVSLHHWVHGLPGELPFRRLGRSDLWGLQLDLPRDLLEARQTQQGFPGTSKTHLVKCCIGRKRSFHSGDDLIR